MNEEGLYEKIKDRKASELFGNLEYQLDLLPPNGATIHKLGNLRQCFCSIKHLYDNNVWPINETIAQYKERDASNFETTMKWVLESRQTFKVLL